MSLLSFSQCRRLGCNLAKWCVWLCLALFSLEKRLSLAMRSKNLHWIVASSFDSFRFFLQSCLADNTVCTPVFNTSIFTKSPIADCLISLPSSHHDYFGFLNGHFLHFSPILQSHPIPQVPILQRAFRHGLHRMHGLWYSHHRRQQRWPHGVRETGARRPGRRGGRLAHGAGNEEAHGHTVRCSMSSWNLM